MSHTVANEVTMSATPMCMPNTMSTSMEPMASNPISISLMRPPLHRSAKAVAQVLPCEQRILDCCEQRTNKNHQVHWPSGERSEEHTSELQSLMRISYAVFCLKKKKTTTTLNK